MDKKKKQNARCFGRSRERAGEASQAEKQDNGGGHWRENDPISNQAENLMPGSVQARLVLVVLLSASVSEALHIHPSCLRPFAPAREVSEQENRNFGGDDLLRSSISERGVSLSNLRGGSNAIELPIRSLISFVRRKCGPQRKKEREKCAQSGVDEERNLKEGVATIKNLHLPVGDSPNSKLSKGWSAVVVHAVGTSGSKKTRNVQEKTHPENVNELGSEHQKP